MYRGPKMTRNEETLAEINDMIDALNSAIAHSGAGEQRRRWEALLESVAVCQRQFTRRVASERAAAAATPIVVGEELVAPLPVDEKPADFVDVTDHQSVAEDPKPAEPAAE